jgi:hypothetical protein
MTYLKKTKVDDALSWLWEELDKRGDGELEPIDKEILKTTYLEYVAHRNRNFKPLTHRGLKAMMSKWGVEELTVLDIAHAFRASVMGNWQGVFAQHLDPQPDPREFVTISDEDMYKALPSAEYEELCNLLRDTKFGHASKAIVNEAIKLWKQLLQICEPKAQFSPFKLVMMYIQWIDEQEWISRGHLAFLNTNSKMWAYFRRETEKHQEVNLYTGEFL